MRIALLFRKKSKDKFSIEELFHSIYNAMKAKGINIEKVETTNSTASISSIFSNIKTFDSSPFNLVHITGDVHYMVFGCKCPSVLTIHDVGSALSGNRLRKFAIKCIWLWLPGYFANRITVISETSKNELLKIIPFAKRKIRVIYNPVNPLIKEVDKKFNKENPLILQIGTKNNKNLVRSIKSLQGIKCELLIIGKLSKKHKLLLEEYEINYSNHTNIDYNKIVKYYQQCDMVLFVSTYEGFGMPIIEAQKTGRAVITSNISSMPEIAGDGACIIDPYDIDEIRNAILKVITNESYRTELIINGKKNVERFHIDAIVKKYLSLYQEVLD